MKIHKLIVTVTTNENGTLEDAVANVDDLLGRAIAELAGSEEDYIELTLKSVEPFNVGVPTSEVLP